ncbi:CatB-related O-acetyltransferase [Sphingobium sufflavum]|uniref:CatB-related O-acetyltransferase n=1 Tax=Sphingobium sufflavum TaxID=1129547 RepID=UPI001F394462|nr:CatB-related O-acetyltransferase [Sphingobium sufflavum]MCE7798523.1 CatB-related O-acetyltransferase [Sphingobium sufflavum]
MLASLIEKLRIKWWSRTQYRNDRLRAYFRDHFRIDVGYYSYGCFDQWRMPGPLRVGRYCSIANTVRSAPINHPMDALTTHPALYERAFGVVDQDIHWDTPLVIEDDVWIGSYAVLLPGCKAIGRGAVVGAGAIVTHDVAPYTIVAGNPARKIRDRFDPAMIHAIEASRWWERDAADLRALWLRNPDLLLHPTVAALEIWAREGGK